MLSLRAALGSFKVTDRDVGQSVVSLTTLDRYFLRMKQSTNKNLGVSHDIALPTPRPCLGNPPRVRNVYHGIQDQGVVWVCDIKAA